MYMNLYILIIKLYSLALFLFSRKHEFLVKLEQKICLNYRTCILICLGRLKKGGYLDTSKMTNEI